MLLLLMNTVFKPCLRRFVLVFFVDILVFSETLDERIVDLKAVLELSLNSTAYLLWPWC